MSKLKNAYLKTSCSLLKMLQKCYEKFETCGMDSFILKAYVFVLRKKREWIVHALHGSDHCLCDVIFSSRTVLRRHTSP